MIVVGDEPGYEMNNGWLDCDEFPTKHERHSERKGGEGFYCLLFMGWLRRPRHGRQANRLGLMAN